MIRPHSISQRRLIALILLLLSALLPAFAEDPKWVIASVDIVIDGATKESVLKRNLNIEEGATFESLEALETYLAEKRKTLMGIRLFQSSSLEYSTGEERDGVFPVAVSITAKDTWNIIALPYPRYDSNNGFRLSVKFRNYNAFGSMEPLNIDADYELSTSGESTFGASLAFTLPLSWQDDTWALFTSHSFEYPLDAPVEYKGFIGIRKMFDNPIASSHVQLRQGFVSIDEDGDGDVDPYLRAEVGAYTKASIFPDFANGTGYASAKLTAGYDYGVAGPLPADVAGADLGLLGIVSIGRIDWNGNFRQGWFASVSDDVGYQFESDDWANLLTATFRVDAPLIPKRLGTSIRFVGLVSYPDPEDDLGSYMRGVRDDDIETDLAGFANFSLVAKLFDFTPSRYISKQWLDMEVQGSVFFDAGLVRGSTGSAPELYMASGVEFFAFPKLARSMFARISVGFDILNYAESGSLPEALELYFGLGAHY